MPHQYKYEVTDLGLSVLERGGYSGLAEVIVQSLAVMKEIGKPPQTIPQIQDWLGGQSREIGHYLPEVSDEYYRASVDSVKLREIIQFLVRRELVRRVG